MYNQKTKYIYIYISLYLIFWFDQLKGGCKFMQDVVYITMLNYNQLQQFSGIEQPINSLPADVKELHSLIYRLS